MDSLVRRFDSLRAPVLSRHARPTDGTIDKINEHFGIRLPRTLVQLAKHSAAYDAYFLSIGADYASQSHIIRVNSYWRRRRMKRRIPPNLVVITEGYMDDLFWCLDTSSPCCTGDGYAVQFWCPEKLTYSSSGRPVQRYPDFESYMEGVIKWSA